MDFKEIKNTKHYLFDDLKEFMVYHPTGVVRHNWRHGEEKEWVFTDDNFVCQILRKTKVAKENGRSSTCIRTVCGTFLSSDKGRNMLGENGIAENIYTFSGKNIGKDRYKENRYNSKELVFARYVASGMTAVEAYKKVYPDANSEAYIKQRCDKLLRTEKIDKMISEERRKKLEEEGVTDNWLIERYKTICPRIFIFKQE